MSCPHQMADIVDKKTRSRMMSGIRGKNTRPELTIRKALFAKGFRYRIHDKHLPGKPDMVFQKYKAVIFVHGCFWHGHNCQLFKWPKANREFWKSKIERNKFQDKTVSDLLHSLCWRHLTIWECTLKGKGRQDFDTLIRQASDWLTERKASSEIRGTAININHENE